MRSKINIAIVCVAVGSIAIVSLVMMLNTEQKDVMGLREAEKQVELVKTKLSVPDEETRKKIDELINETRREEFVQVGDQTVSVASEACSKLRQTGKIAILQLVEAAGKSDNRHIRRRSVSVINMLIRHDKSNKQLEFLPVFVRSTYDDDLEVRGTATAQIGNMARVFFREKAEKELEEVIPYLVKAMNSNEERMEAYAVDILYRIKRKDLIPEELIEKYRIGTEY